MHPDVCTFISVASYEDRLHPDKTAGSQDLRTLGGLSIVDAGIRAIEHLKRSQVSPGFLGKA